MADLSKAPDRVTGEASGRSLPLSVVVNWEAVVARDAHARNRE